MQQPQKCDDIWKVCVPKDFTHPSTTITTKSLLVSEHYINIHNTNKISKTKYSGNVPVGTTVKNNCASLVIKIIPKMNR